jgi:uncharacterized protein YjeT (DUF2065 family)
VRDFLTALCLALVMEGVAYALFPGGMQRLIASVLAMQPSSLRMFGLAIVAAGVAGVWLVRTGTAAP